MMFLPVSEIKHKAEKTAQRLTVFLYSPEKFQKWEVPLSSGPKYITFSGNCEMLGPGSKNTPQKGHWADRWVEIMQLKWCAGKWCSSSIQTVEQVLCHWPQWQKIKLNPIKGKKPSILVSPAGTWKLLSVWKNGRALEKMEVSVLMTMFAPPGKDGSLF